MALKDLTYKVKYDVDDKAVKDLDKGLDKAEDTAEDLVDELKKSNKETKELGKNTKEVNSGFDTLKAILASKAISMGISLIGKGIRGAKDLTKDLLQTASDGLESVAKFEIVFGSMAADTFNWIEDVSDLIGRGRGDLRGYLADTQTLLFGYTDQSEKMRQVTAEMSKDITRFGLDLAAMNDVADDDAIASLQSGLVGNHMALKGLGIALTENTLKLTMQGLGIQGNFKDLDELTKIQIRYITALEQSQTAIGHAERESEDYASQVKMLQGTFRDIKEELGVELIPIAIEFMHTIQDNKDLIIDLGKEFVGFIDRSGRKLIDWFGDTDNVRVFKEDVLKVADAIFKIADAIVVVGEKLASTGEKREKWRDWQKGVKSSRRTSFGYEDPNIVDVVDKGPSNPGAVSKRQIPGFAKGTRRTPDTFIAGEEGPELITGMPNRTVLTNKETNQVLNKSTTTSSINISVPISIDGSRRVASGEMRQEIEDFFGELLVKHGYVEV